MPKRPEDHSWRPSEAKPLTRFDTFATRTANMVAKAWFFGFCILTVIIWLPSWFFIRDINIWQLIINTLTTIITFLLVALLQNTESRADAATQRKLNAIAAALGDLLEKSEIDETELREAVGLEHKEGV